MAPPILSDAKKAKARHHLGYGGVQEAQTFAMGIPASVQTSFMIEGALNKLLPESLPLFDQLIAAMDGIETQMLGDQELLAVTQIDTIQIRPDEFKQLKLQYQHWQASLGNLLLIPPNPFDQRFGGLGGGGVNVRVNHG